MIITDTQGDSLIGAIDGINKSYRLSLPADIDTVQVYVNGRNKVASLDDGFLVADAQTILLKEAPLAGDTIAISYTLSGTNTLGGQPGGVPPIAAVCQDGPPAFTVEAASVPARDAELAPPPFCGC